MKRRKSVATTAATVLAVASVAIAVGGGTANADPTESVGYETSVTTDGSVSTVLDAGAFRIDSSDNSVDVVGNSGTVLASLPLTYSVNGATYSIAPAVVGDRQLLLTPQPASLINDAAGPVSKQAAFDNMINQIVIGYTGGGAVGTAVGAGLGFAIGCVSIFPNFIAGCIIGTAIGVVAGTIIGTVNANPNVQPAVFEYFTTP
ncbi:MULTISPECIES: hypothetical protein [Nocardiaceae]|uniref:hypothetical protein n=1 Tax=Nocardiaceae TaxID=85025 RepID=UPI0003815DD2|nr:MULTISPECIES: hypothetical protein [Rhodococcus]OZD05390.1 hypothetical protein CH280_26580 [Rhodococcus sp. 06-156-4C]OZD16502.1 hypothetical protein CH248_19550 [Rhodococcus sp. 06-156-4a]OZD26361.1 hypothetical protein CH253_01070 [Rhodococcus sp. 06-156-3C]OZD31756.1 hypothetical protein CH247_11380 [Rhodococcus sp. 06-156-3b]OZD35055.1 hypothetical protein CH284_14120 [Rhodococcus sp. 06-156-3]